MRRLAGLFRRARPSRGHRFEGSGAPRSNALQRPLAWLRASAWSRARALDPTRHCIGGLRSSATEDAIGNSAWQSTSLRGQVRFFSNEHDWVVPSDAGKGLLGDVVWPQGAGLEHVPNMLLTTLGAGPPNKLHLVLDWRPRRSRTHAGDSDPVSQNLSPERIAESDHGKLGRAVRGHQGRGEETGGR